MMKRLALMVLACVLTTPAAAQTVARTYHGQFVGGAFTGQSFVIDIAYDPASFISTFVNDDPISKQEIYIAGVSSYTVKVGAASRSGTFDDIQVNDSKSNEPLVGGPLDAVNLNSVKGYENFQDYVTLIFQSPAYKSALTSSALPDGMSLDRLVSRSINGYLFIGTDKSPEGSINVSIGLIDLSSAAPEPATWALMIMGFGAAGAAMRRSRKITVAYA